MQTRLKARILHLIATKGFFGAENVLLEICLQLRENPFFTPIVGLFDNGGSGHLPLLERCRKHGLEPRSFPCRGQFDWQCVRQLRRFISENRVDIVHSHGYKSNLYALLARHGRVGLVSTCHNWISAGFKMGLYAGVDKVILRYFDRIVAVSEVIEAELLRVMISRGKIAVIDNGIDITRFRPDQGLRERARRDMGIPQEAIVIGWVGRISKEKGLDILMETARPILEDRHDVIILLVGDGPLRQSLESAHSSSGIRFAGLRNDTPACYAAFDIFALPSLNEGLPMVVLEAMASGLPVVASRVGAIPKVVEHGETGFLVEPGRPDLLEAAIGKLIKDRIESRQMGSKGRERVEHNFSSAVMAGNYEVLYRQVMEGRTA